MKTSFCSIAAACTLLATFSTSAIIAPTQARAEDTSKSKAKALNHKLDGDLRQAVEYANFSGVHKSLSRGADPNTKSSGVDAVPLLAFIILAKTDNQEQEGAKWKMMHAFVEAGADLEATDIYGNTALWDAAADGNMPALNYLLLSGANLEHGNDKGLTPLMAAASYAQENAVRALTDAGAKVNARSRSDVTALIAAATFDPATKNPSYSDGLDKSLRLAIVHWLVSKGADIDARMKGDVDAIAVADATGLPEVSAFLRDVKTNAANASSTPTKTPTANPLTGNPLAIDDDGATTLMQLAKQKPFDATQGAALLKSGVDVNATDKHIQTALMYACATASPDAVRFLLKNGANANFVSVGGDTALSLSVLSGDSDTAFDVAQRLIAAGADANFKNHDGKSALDFARDKSNGRVVNLLSKATVSKQSTPEPVSTEDALKVDDNGYTTLMFAMSCMPFDAANAALLIKAGVNVNAVEINTESTLIIACVSASSDAVRFLLKNNAKVNYADKDGATALMYIAFSDDAAAALDITGQLIAAGANVNAKAKDGTTALAAARAKPDQGVVDALLKAGAK